MRSATRAANYYWVLSVALFLALPTSALADEPTDEDIEAARVEFNAAEQHFAAGRYAEAVDAYKRAHSRMPRAGFLYNIAQAYRLQSDCSNAVQYYRQFLDTDPEGDLRKQTETHLASLGECPTDNSANEKPVQKPVEEPVEEAANGTELSHRPLTEEPDVGSGDANIVTTEVSPTSSGWRRPTGIVVAAVGVAAAATGGYYLYRSKKINDELKRASADRPITFDRYEKGEFANLMSWVLIPSGAAAIAAGTGIYLWGRSDDGSSSSLEVAPTEGGGQMLWSGTF